MTSPKGGIVLHSERVVNRICPLHRVVLCSEMLAISPASVISDVASRMAPRRIRLQRELPHWLGLPLLVRVLHSYWWVNLDGCASTSGLSKAGWCFGVRAEQRDESVLVCAWGFVAAGIYFTDLDFGSACGVERQPEVEDEGWEWQMDMAQEGASITSRINIPSTADSHYSVLYVQVCPGILWFSIHGYSQIPCVLGSLLKR